MIMTRAPLRVSLAGGGSDLPDFFETEPGAVLGFTLESYVYVVALPLSPVAHENARFTYRVTESVEHPRHLQHPVVREALLERPSSIRLNLATMADVPGGTGLGSSSSFTVALLQALDSMQGTARSADALARDAIRLEREKLGEAGGWQDQMHAAIGGFRLYEFGEEGASYREPFAPTWLAELQECMVLVHPGWASRDSSAHQLQLRRRIMTGDGAASLRRSARVARDGFAALQACTQVDVAHEILCDITAEAWRAKSQGAGGMPTEIEEVLAAGASRGAIAGKLCGAGGSGFVLFIIEPGTRERFALSWPEVHCMPVRFSRGGVETVIDTEAGTESGDSSLAVESHAFRSLAAQPI